MGSHQHNLFADLSIFMNPILYANPFIWSQFLLSMPKFHEYSAEVASRNDDESKESAKNEGEASCALKSIPEEQVDEQVYADINESSSEDGKWYFMLL